MAGRGPAKDPDAIRRNKDTVPTVKVQDDGKLRGPELPEDALPDGEAWHSQTKRWWENWRRSPQAVQMMTDPDWDFLLDTALMHHKMWSSGRWDFAAEIRLRAAKYGATPEDRNRLRMSVEVPDPAPVGNGQAGTGGVIDMEDRRRRLGG